MKALNKESILDCDELETQLHDAEIKQLDEQIFLMPNYPCEFEVTFLDDYHKKHNYPLFYESYLQNVMEFLESQDIKNGADAFVHKFQGKEKNNIIISTVDDEISDFVEYVAERASDILNVNLDDLKIITCHLGNGASVSAIKPSHLTFLMENPRKKPPG